MRKDPMRYMNYLKHVQRLAHIVHPWKKKENFVEWWHRVIQHYDPAGYERWYDQDNTEWYPLGNLVQLHFQLVETERERVMKLAAEPAAYVNEASYAVF